MEWSRLSSRTKEFSHLVSLNIISNLNCIIELKLLGLLNNITLHQIFHLAKLLSISGKLEYSWWTTVVMLPFPYCESQRYFLPENLYIPASSHYYCTSCGNCRFYSAYTEKAFKIFAVTGSSLLRSVTSTLSALLFLCVIVVKKKTCLSSTRIITKRFVSGNEL